VLEKRSGQDEQYLAQADLSEPLDSGALTPGGIVGEDGAGGTAEDGVQAADIDTDTGAEEGTEPEAGAEGEEDIPYIDGLPEERREELKGETHVFLAKVEEQYGDMSDIYVSSCAVTPQVCQGHAISGNYLTMATGGGNVSLALKYVDKRWRLYVLDFKQ